MRHWPTSLPDYKWPAHYVSAGMAPLRWLLAAAFHIAYGLGLMAALPQRRRPRVLVIRTDGLGDGLLFEPALESLARALSPREIHLWAPQLTCELLAHCPTVRRMFAIPRGFKSGNLAYFKSFRWRMRIGFELGRWRFDKVIYPVESPEPLGNWLFASARAEHTWLNYADTVNQFDWQRAATHERATRVIECRPGSAHELLRNEYLASQWSGENQLRAPKLYLSEAINAKAEAQVDAWRSAARKLGAAEVVAVMPAASMPIKSYPTDRWAAALKRLWREQRSLAVLLGGPADGAQLDVLARELAACEVPHLRLTQRPGILEMAAIVARLDGLLSVDTGLAHLAVAQSVPTVVLVGGGTPGRFFPWPNAKQHVVLNVPMPCDGCNNRCTLDEPSCIHNIPRDDLVAAYSRLKGRRVELEVYVAPTAKFQKVG